MASEISSQVSVTLETALNNRCLLVIGDAGSGKTTFLRRIAWELCAKPDRTTPRKRLNLPCKGFPMFIRVSSLDRHIHETIPRLYKDPDDPRWLSHYLASQPGAAQGALDETFFQEKLCGEDNILLLDGLDEAADEQRRACIAKLVAKASAQGCHYVVSTRPNADQRRAVLPRFAKCEVLPLDDAGIRQFLTTWCTWLPRDEAYLTGLLHDVSLTPFELRSNPFMLTALAVVYLQQKRLPHQRADLYEAIVDWLSLQAEERWGKPGYRRHFILNCLQRLALAMQDRKGGRITVISVNEAAPLIMDQFASDLPRTGLDDARDFLERAKDASGILTLRDGLLAFWHKLFLEYLAARRFTFLYPPDERTALGRTFLYSAEGREVLPLAAVRMKDDYDYLPTLFAALIEDAYATHELPAMAHAVGVLGSMLRDLKSTSWKLPPASDNTYHALLKVVLAIFDARFSGSVTLQTRLEAAEALGAAGDPRLFTPADPEYWVSIAGAGTIPSFQIGRFPVTVDEYTKYLADKTTAVRPKDWDTQEPYRSRPVTGVSWHEAMEYCVWASRPDWKVTLPTDRQWEFAARGTEQREYPWGNDDPTPDHANYIETGIRPAATPVGLFPAGNTPGLDGISDMAGNVWEWTRSAFDKEGKVKSVRGGSFGYSAWFLRAASRDYNEAGDRFDSLGFRCVRE